MSRYDLIIFDCDGTLVDSELVYNHSAIDTFVQYGFPRYPLEYTLQNWMGKSLQDIVAAEVEKNNLELSTDDFIETYLSIVPGYQGKYLKKIEGALEAVRELQKNFKCCVASNGEMRNILMSLNLMGYSELFDENHVFCKDQVARAKPCPDLFFFACEKMQMDAGKAIVIEDSIPGVKAGRAAGTYVIGFNGVGHGELQSEEKLIEAGADIVFSTWKDMLNHINSL